jgi:hypothetical protein
MAAKTAIRFWITESERRAINDAARDAHMEVADYARLMVLAAAGMGGVLEHVERAVRASSIVDQRGGLEISVRKIGDPNAAD